MRKLLPTGSGSRSPNVLPEPRRAGFSLVEVLLAVLVLGVAVTGLVQASTMSLKGLRDSERLTRAVSLASARMELLRADSYLFAGDLTETADSPFESYSIRELIEEDTTHEGLYRVKITVSWEPTGHELYELETLLFEKPFDSSISSTSDPSTSPTSPLDRGRDRRPGARGSRIPGRF